MKGNCASPSHTYRVLIVDDHPIVREGIAAVINRERDMEVCGQAEDAGDALLLGAWAGLHSARRLSQARFDQAVLAATVVSALALVLR